MHEEKTVAELKKLAKKMGMVGYSSKTRAQLLAALRRRSPKTKSRKPRTKKCVYGVRKDGKCKKKPGRRLSKVKSRKPKKASKKASRKKMSKKLISERRKYFKRMSECSAWDDIDECNASPSCKWSPKSNRCVRKSRASYAGPLPEF